MATTWKWLEETCEVLCKRTAYPKLGYIIHELNERHIPSVLYGHSFHGPLLWVRRADVDKAWKVLNMKMSTRAKKTLDDLPDDERRFTRYFGTKPNMTLWGDDEQAEDLRRAVALREALGPKERT